MYVGKGRPSEKLSYSFSLEKGRGGKRGIVGHSHRSYALERGGIDAPYHVPKERDESILLGKGRADGVF